jgi:hypothetical protein
VLAANVGDKTLSSIAEVAVKVAAVVPLTLM